MTAPAHGASPLPENPARVYTDPDGYEYSETSQWLKDALALLPCFEALTWPDYATTIIEDTIDGRKVVIQLWKGWSQRFLGSRVFPGGIGAEVGVYERVPERQLPTTLSFLEPPAAAFMLKALSVLDERKVWWPATTLRTEIEYELINPETNKTFFHAPPQTTYWRNKWMNPHHYARYRRNQEKRWEGLPWWLPGNSRTPPFAVGYQQRYKINGKTYPVW